MNNKIKKCGCFIVLGILFLMLLNTISCTLAPKIVSKLKINNEKVNELFKITKSTPPYDFTIDYPFEDNDKDNTENETRNLNIIDKYLSLINTIKTKLEANTSKRLIGYQKSIELSYIYNKLISYKLVSNEETSRIILEGDYYTRLRQKNNMKILANKLIKLNNELKDENIDFLYIQVPNKISPTQEISPIYYDYTNENTDELLKLIKNKVEYIDIRDNIQQNNLNHLSLYFKTDHHWLPETGRWVTEEISKYLNDNYDTNLEIDNITEEKFQYKKYSNIFLGSDGRYVSLANAKPEDLTLITPKYKTNLRITIPEKKINKVGSFDKTIIDKSQLKYTNYYNISQYEAYMYGDRALIEVKNNLVNNNKKILLIKDSYANVVSPFLSLENEYLSTIDLRYFNGSLKSYIEKFKPDIVLTLYSGFTISDVEIGSSDQLLVNRLIY